MTAAASIATLVAPAANPAATRSTATSADGSTETSFAALLEQVQATDTGAQDTGTVSGDTNTAAIAASTQAAPLAATQVPDVAPVVVLAPEQVQEIIATTPVQDALTEGAADPAAQAPAPRPDAQAILIAAFATSPQATASESTADTAPDATATAIPATAATAIQAQALAAAIPAGTATPKTVTDTPADGSTAPADATSLDEDALNKLFNLAARSPDPTLTGQDTPLKPTTPRANGGDLQTPAVMSAATQPEGAGGEATPSTQGVAASTFKGPQQPLGATPSDPARGSDPLSPPPGGPLQSSPASFSVELRQVATPAHGMTAHLPVPIDALAVNIARRVEQGLNQFEISLTPAELGKLDISLKIADDGRLHAVIRAERADTLDLLRQDARTLENQLRQAGLDVGSNALSFQLSQGQAHGFRSSAAAQAYGGMREGDERAQEQVAATYIASRRPDGIDIQV